MVINMKKKNSSIALTIVLLSQLVATASFAESNSVIDEGTTLTSKGFTFYTAQNFDTDTLDDYVTVYKNDEKIDGITITKLQKKTTTMEHNATKAKDIPINIPYRVTLPEQITESGDVYTLEIDKSLSADMTENYSKSLMLNVLMYDNFDNYTGTVATGKDSANQPIRTSEGSEKETWLGKAWTFDNNSSGNYDTHIVMSIDNGRLKVDYKTKEDDGKCQGNARIRSTSQDEHTEWKDYTVEYDLTVLENAASYVGGVFPRANAMDNNKAPALHRSGFAAFGNSFAVVGTPDIPALNTTGHIEATAIAGTTNGTGSYSLIVDNDYFCKVTNNVNGTDFITATGTPHFAACSDQDFYMDNLVVSKSIEVENFSIDNQESYPAEKEIVLKTNRSVDSDSIDAADFSVYTGTDEAKESITVLNAEAIDENTIKLILEKNLKNKTSYTVKTVGELTSHGKNIMFKNAAFTVEPKAIDVENITSNGNVYTVKIKNYRADEITVFATFAAYDKNNKLIAVNGGSYVLNTDTFEENRTITITADEVEYVKCYILNGLENINTVAEEKFKNK